MNPMIPSLLLALVPASEDPRPEPLEDNSFFIEEAYNQEEGVVQHIFNVFWRKGVSPGTRSDALDFVFTQEWPVPDQTHQLSYTIPYAWLWQEPEDIRGVRDILLNYRYQLLEETPDLPAFSPRLSAVLPAGDEEEGLGSGGAGFQANLPLSKRIGERFFFHLNAGTRIIPAAEVDLPGGGDSGSELLADYSFGFSVIYMITPLLNPLVEFVGARIQDLDPGTGEKDDRTELFVAPGIRWGIDLPKDYQLVLGTAVPLGLNDDTDDYGVFFYLSLEGPLWGAASR